MLSFDMLAFQNGSDCNADGRINRGNDSSVSFRNLMSFCLVTPKVYEA